MPDAAASHAAGGSGRVAFQRWRHAVAAAEALVVLGLPFLSLGGESALRLDVPAGRLHAFGASFSIDEAYVVLAALLLAIALFLLVTLLFGRVFCGWACPQTVLGDLASRLLGDGFARRALVRSDHGRPAPPSRSSSRRSIGWRRPVGLVAVALLSGIAAANLLWYFVAPAEFFRRLGAGRLGPVLGGSWLVLSLILFLDLGFVRATFCATACPYAKLQGVLFDRSTLVVAFDERREPDCVGCDACVRACPTGIDIRGGLQTECIACAACIDACEPIMAKLRRATNLVGYFYGEPGLPPRPLRPAVLALFGAALASAALLVFVLSTRPLLDLSAIPDQAFAPRRAADGRIVNAYSVALENHGRVEVGVGLSISSPGAEIDVRPDRITLAPGERRQVEILTLSRGLAMGRSQAELRAEARSGPRTISRRSETIPILAPVDGR